MSTFRTVKLNPAALQSKGLEDAIAILAEAMVEARETEMAAQGTTEHAATKEAAK